MKFELQLLYSHLQHHATSKRHNNRQTHDDKDAVINDAHRKTQKDFFIKYFPLTLFVRVQRVTQSFRVKGSWRPKITEIFWPRSYGRQRCVFLVFHGCLTGTLSVGCSFPYHIFTPTGTRTQLSSTVQFVGLILPSNTHAVIWTRLHTSASSSDIWRPGCVTSAILEWPVWLSSSGNNCHAVQRSLSSGASVYESIMRFLLPRPISSANFRTRDFLLTAIRICHFLPVHHHEWYFWPGQQVKT